MATSEGSEIEKHGVAGVAEFGIGVWTGYALEYAYW